MSSRLAYLLRFGLDRDGLATFDWLVNSFNDFSGPLIIPLTQEAGSLGIRFTRIMLQAAEFIPQLKKSAKFPVPRERTGDV